MRDMDRIPYTYKIEFRPWLLWLVRLFGLPHMYIGFRYPHAGVLPEDDWYWGSSDFTWWSLWGKRENAHPNVVLFCRKTIIRSDYASFSSAREHESKMLRDCDARGSWMYFNKSNNTFGHCVGLRGEKGAFAEEYLRKIFWVDFWESGNDSPTGVFLFTRGKREMLMLIANHAHYEKDTKGKVLTPVKIANRARQGGLQLPDAIRDKGRWRRRYVCIPIRRRYIRT